jgi:hypothetical protein
MSARGSSLPLVLLCMAALAGAVIGGCGGEDEDPAPAGSVIEQAPPLKSVLITSADRRRFDADSVERDFLSYWSALQFQALHDVATSFHPGLLKEIGMQRLAAAIRLEAAYLRSVKPRIERVQQRSQDATVYYVVKDVRGKETPRSITFGRFNGTWKIVYDSFLDDALRDSVQNGTQIAINPAAPKAPKQAVQAGYSAGQLQSSFLGRRFGVAPAAETGRTGGQAP